MKALIQRVFSAEVRVGSSLLGKIGAGILVFLGVERGDTEEDARFLARKTAGLRIFPDPPGRAGAGRNMNRSLLETGGSALVVSQFTLAADTRKGNRPSFDRAAAPEPANRLYLLYIDRLKSEGVPVEAGRFQAMMDVELVNQGPVTLLLESGKGVR